MKRLSVNERNQQITYYLNRCILKARKNEFKVKEKEVSEFDILFSSTAWGFREIVLVIAAGKHLELSYSPTTDLYSCNPRSLFERDIRPILQANGIPHRKSGPLNIAKATQGLNDAWAAQREPKRLGECVVRLAIYIENLGERELDNFTIALLAKFLGEAKRVESIDVDFDIEANSSFLYDLCCFMIDNAPDAGNTPQRFTGTLLKCFHEDINSGIVITGYEHRASVTSTTSKKPGDINEESSDGAILSVYEVTIKPFGDDRITESYDTIKIYNDSTTNTIDEVKVICRSSDCPIPIENRVSSFFFGTIQYNDVEYAYIDIYQWVASIIVHMTRDGRKNFYENLKSYVSEFNTAETVKNAWRDFQSK